MCYNFFFCNVVKTYCTTSFAAAGAGAEPATAGTKIAFVARPLLIYTGEIGQLTPQKAEMKRILKLFENYLPGHSTSNPPGFQWKTLMFRPGVLDGGVLKELYTRSER